MPKLTVQGMGEFEVSAGKRPADEIEPPAVWTAK